MATTNHTSTTTSRRNQHHPTTGRRNGTNKSSSSLIFVIMMMATTLLAFTSFSEVVFGFKTLDTIPTFSKLNNLTVSGFGAGGSMAIMMQVAHSQKVGGVASFSGLPYYCVKNNMTRLETCFKHAEQIPMTEFMEMFEKFIYFNLIDNLDHIPSHKIYLQSGAKDKSLTQQAALKSKEMYETLGVPKNRIKTVLDIPSGHSMVSIDYSNSEKNQCGEEIREPYIQNCGIDLVGDALKFVIGEDNFVNLANFVVNTADNLFIIDQRPFDSERHLMGDFGYMYIPSACQKDETKCKHIHVAFHGCDQTGEEFPLYSGYNRIAEQNNIIVMYPRTATQKRFNPHACWDFFGTENGDDYRAELYPSRIGPQMQTVARMVEQAGHDMDMKRLIERSAKEALVLLGALVAIVLYQMYKLTIGSKKDKSD